MKTITKRFGVLLLVIAMFMTMIPVFSISVSAAGTLTVSDANIGLSWTDASNSSGSASWTASGDTITGTATGYKVISIISRTVTTTLTIKNNYADTRTLSFSYTLSGGGSVSGISGNAYSGELAAGGTLVITLTSPSGASTNTLTITGIKLIGNSNVTTTFAAPENGSYTVDGTAITAETSYTKAPDASNYAMTATANSGYTFYGWYNETSGTYMSYDVNTTLSVGSDATIKPVFVAGNPAHFSVGGQRFYDLSEAVAAAQAGSDKKIVVIKDGTVTGSHTIPSGITLLVPYNDAHSAHGSSPSCTSYDDLLGGKGSIAWVTPTRYRTLTLGADAHITVNGVLEVGGRHASAAGGSPHNGRYGGSPTGPLGFINMQAGSHIDLNSGSTLYCWGYIYGDGTITAKSGSAVYENFQIMDFRGGDKSTELAQGFLVFPTAQYHVQNIEVATRYEYGSTEYVHTSVYMSRMEHGATVQFIGSEAMFRPQPDSYVIKDYDPTTDTLILESYGDCALSELAMSIAGVDVDAGQFVLPITNNMQIHIKSGTATLQQNVMMLPGSSLTVDQGATLNIAYTDATTDVVTAGGYMLQMFDYDNYTWGIDMDTFEVVADRYYNYWDRNAGMRTRPVPFTCTTRKTRTEADLVDAKLDINGTLISNGYIYSTVTYADILNEDYTITGNGANICSSEGTGVIQMVNGAGGDVFGVMYDQTAPENTTDGVYYYIPLASAQLTNGDGTMLDTTAAEAGTTYQVCPTCGCWYTGECAACSDPCADGHSYEGVQTTAPTCTEAGEMTYTCSVCGDSYTETIAALGHTPGAAADCENAQTCTVCGTVLNAALGHNWVDADCDTPKTCSVCGETKGDALGHSYNAVETPADCENDGSIVYTCSVCGDSYTETIAALGHTPGAEADCENAQTCTVCGTVLNAALGHNWVDADCDTPKTCSVCGETEGEALGHNWTDATCTAPKTCSVCGETEGDALGHSYNAVETPADCENDGSIVYTCSVCGDSYTETIAALGHTPGAEADCENAQTCTVCGEVLNAALGHSYVGEQTKAPTCGDAGEMTYTCSACGDSYTEEIAATGEHSYFYPCDIVCQVCYQESNTNATHAIVAVEAVEATCTENGNIAYWYCEHCGSAWSDEALTQVTNRFNVIVPAAGGHSYDHDFDANCNACGAVRDVVGPLTFIGKSVSEDVSGLAFLFQANIEGIALKEGTFVQADFTNATYNGYKLLGLGVVASNGVSETNIEGVRMYDLEENVALFAFRVINIPADKLDVEITMTPYYVVEINGEAVTVYDEPQTANYNDVAAPAMM